MRSLTTTSYAILGLLALRSWSAYELTQQMARGLRLFWPRTESKLYEEPKTLVAHGYATAERQPGVRPRTVYTITPAGREALRHWLSEPGNAPTIEFDGLVKTFFAEQGTRDDLLATLYAVRAQGEVLLGFGAVITRQYVEGETDFAERTHVNALVNRFLLEYLRMYTRWAAWAITEVERWPDVSPTPDALAHGRAIMRETLTLLPTPNTDSPDTGEDAS